MKIKDLKVMIKEAMDEDSVLLKKPDLLKESGLSRLYQHMTEHESAILTAYRNDTADMTQCMEPADLPEKNQIRNRNLKATLLAMNVGVTKVDG